MPDLGTDKLGTASPRPDISLMSSLVSTSPAQLSFVLSEDGDNEEEMDVTPAVTPTVNPAVAATVTPMVTPTVTIKPFTETWAAVKELGALVTTPNILPGQQAIVAATPQILTVKQEVLTQPVLAPARCESQSSTVSSPEGSVSNVTTPAQWNGDNAATGSSDIEMLKLKVEDDDDADSQDAGKNSPLPESQDEWEGQSASPPPSDNAAEDSMPSTSSQDGDPPSGTDLPANGDCSCENGDGKDEVKAKMQRLLELEERWDRMYDQELGIWEEERARQQQQRTQDRELQQQLLSVLTDIRDELRQLRQERATARQNQTAANGSPAKAEEPENPKAAAETPKATAAEQRPPPSTGKRRGRPRLIKPAPEPARPIRPAPGPSSNS